MSVEPPDKLNIDLVRLVQYGLMAQGYPLQDHGGADGIWGPATERAFNTWQSTRRAQWPEDDTRALTAFFGAVDFEAGRAPQQTNIRPPYPMHIAWGDGAQLTSIRCHRLVAASLSGALRDIAMQYSYEDIKRHGLDRFGGTTNVRFMRGGQQLSRHSWGIAIDIDPVRNGLHTRTEDAYIPNYCPEVVQIFKRHGWISLGERIGRDWMHFQATR